jgi:hypothetical protein
MDEMVWIYGVLGLALLMFVIWVGIVVLQTCEAVMKDIRQREADRRAKEPAEV